MKKLHIKKKIAIIGAGGHASVCSDILELEKKKPTFIVVSKKNEISTLKRIKYKLTDREFISQFKPDDVDLINGIGIVPGKNRFLRKEIYERYSKLKYDFLTLIHPSATISNTAKIYKGAQIMAGSIVQCNVTIEKNVIINSGSIIEHDCYIGENSHIAPGSTLCGNVKINKNVFLPAGSIIKPNITISKDSKK